MFHKSYKKHFTLLQVLRLKDYIVFAFVSLFKVPIPKLWQIDKHDMKDTLFLAHSLGKGWKTKQKFYGKKDKNSTKALGQSTVSCNIPWNVLKDYHTECCASLLQLFLKVQRTYN